MKKACLRGFRREDLFQTVDHRVYLDSHNRIRLVRTKFEDFLKTQFILFQTSERFH